jgi:hypothetical protein
MNNWQNSKTLKDISEAYSSIYEAKKDNDDNLANNYPPYDKVTRGDVIAGARGEDQMGGRKKKKKNTNEEVSDYDIVASYLLENNFAETFENVDKIIENMSERWILDILDEAREPGVKPYRPGPSGAEVRSGMRSAEQKKKEDSAGTTGYGPEEKFKSDWKLAARPTPETSARMDKEKPYAKRMTGPLAREYGSRTAAQVTRTVRGPGEPQAVTFARIKSKPSREIIRRPKADD